MVIMQSAAQAGSGSGSGSCRLYLYPTPNSLECALQWIQYFSTMDRHNYRPEHTVCSLLYRLSMVLLVFWMPSWLGWAVRIGPKKKKNEPKKPPTIFECIGIVSESIRRCCLSFGELMITFVAGSAAWSSNPLMQTQAKFSVPVPVPVASPPLPPFPIPVTETRSVALSLDSTRLNWTGRVVGLGLGLVSWKEIVMIEIKMFSLL